MIRNAVTNFKAWAALMLVVVLAACAQPDGREQFAEPRYPLTPVKSANDNNARIASFPGNIIAGIFNFQTAEPLEFNAE